MSAIDKIYNYFDREPDLKVLFIFNDDFLADELREVQWKEGYRFVDFQGDWFTVKYNLDNAWADDRVVLYFRQESPLQKKSLREKFLLLDVLTANMEYKSQNYTQTDGALCGEEYHGVTVGKDAAPVRSLLPGPEHHDRQAG